MIQKFLNGRAFLVFFLIVLFIEIALVHPLALNLATLKRDRPVKWIRHEEKSMP